PNAWLVDEMYERYRADPASVSESWQDFFADYEPAENGEAEPRTEPIDTAEPVEEPKAPKKAEKEATKAPDQEEKEKQPEAQMVPVMSSTFARDEDQPTVTHHEHVGLGLAVDVEKSDGSRTLLVPCIKDADTLDFKGFFAAYEELIRKVRANKLSPDDFAGTT